MSKKKYNKRGKYTVFVFDDNVNTIDHVINQLRDVCGHNHYQAIQCTTIIHSNGKCDVFTGPYNICYEISDDLVQAGLTVVIVSKKNKK
tara:strand:- start:702 stop:968 length:267 start_codon:yes stop_codon:yes gene_type:complete